MFSRPARLAGLLVVLGLTAAGCTSAASGSAAATSAPSVEPGTPSASPSDAHTPLQRLVEGIPTARSPIYHYSVTSSDGSDSGVIDPPGKIAEFATTEHFTKPSYTEVTTTLLTRDRSWVRVKDTPASRQTVPTQWLSLDPKKIKTVSGTPFLYVDESDPGYTNEVFQDAHDVAETSPGHFRGIADMSSSPPGDILTAAHLKALGSKSDTVAFTAALNGQGRLTTTSLSLPAAGKFKASTCVITYDQYGTAAVPKLPAAGQQIKAPSYVYDWYR